MSVARDIDLLCKSIGRVHGMVMTWAVKGALSRQGLKDARQMLHSIETILNQLDQRVNGNASRKN